MTVVLCVFVPWFTDQVNLDESGSQSRQGLLGLESPSVKHIPSMLHVLSWHKKKRLAGVLFSNVVFLLCFSVAITDPSPLQLLQAVSL